MREKKESSDAGSRRSLSYRKDAFCKGDLLRLS